MFDAYFNDIKNKMINKKIQEEKEEKAYLNEDKKPAAAPKNDDKKNDVKPAPTPKRPASAAPKAKPLEPKDKIKPEDLLKIEAQIEKDKK